MNAAEPVIGVCLLSGGAVLAVVRQDPARLAALATAGWEVPCFGGADRRALATARGQLRLPRRCPAAVVMISSTVDATLLGDAGIAQVRAVPADEATRRWSTVDVLVDGRLAAAMEGRAAQLAVGAALALLAPAISVTVGTIDTREYLDSWAVEPLDSVTRNSEIYG